MRPLIFGSSSFTACRIPSSFIHGCWIDCLFSPMNDKAALGHRLSGADTAHFHLYARWISFPARPLGNPLSALFIGQWSAFQYAKSNSHSKISIDSRIQRAVIQLIIHSFCLELSSAGLMRFISCVINMFYCGAGGAVCFTSLHRGEGNMRGGDAEVCWWLVDGWWEAGWLNNTDQWSHERQTIRHQHEREEHWRIEIVWWVR